MHRPGDENGFFSWLWNWLFGKKDDQEEYTGWLTKNGKTYYYSASTHKPVTGIQSVDGKLYYFDADGVMQKNVNFGIDVSKYQSNIDWNKIKKAGVNFVIIRIGYRGYGASGTLVKDPMFEEHFTNARNAGLKVGVYFFTQAVTEDEAREEAQGCNWALNGRKLDYPIYYDTEASTSPNGTGRADGLGKEDRTKCAIAFCEEVKSAGVQARCVRFHHLVPQAGGPGRPAQVHHLERPLRRVQQPHRLRYVAGTEKARINGYSGELDATSATWDDRRSAMDRIRLIASDMDATLLDGHSQLPPDFLHLVQELAGQDILFAAASGRPLYKLEEMFAPVLEQTILVADNGGAVRWRGKDLFVSRMEPEVWHRLRPARRKTGIPLWSAAGERLPAPL